MSFFSYKYIKMLFSSTGDSTRQSVKETECMYTPRSGPTAALTGSMCYTDLKTEEMYMKSTDRNMNSGRSDRRRG